MITLTPEVLDWLQSHHGVISASQLRTLGMGRADYIELGRTGILVPIHKGVYRIASAPVTLASRCLALCLAHPKGFITGPTAGRLAHLRRMPKDDRVHLCVPHGLELDLDHVCVRQSRKIERTDVQQRKDGINIASPWRLAFDLAQDLSALDHASVLEQILHDGLCGIGALALTARRLACPTRPGSKVFVANLASRVPGRPLESHPEVEIAKALSARGIPVQAQSTWLALPNGSSARLDVSVPEVRWGVEVDVHPSHLLLEGTTRDKRRDRQARMIGWQIDRVTELDLLDIETTVDELVRLYELRRGEITGESRLAG